MRCFVNTACSKPLPGADSIKRCHLTSIGNPILEIRRSNDRLISAMGFPLLVRHLYIESGPWLHNMNMNINLPMTQFGVSGYPPGSPCPIYWTYILYSLLQFEHMWTINLLVIIYINTSTIDFYKFGIKSAVCFFLWHSVNPRWQPLCRSDSTRSERVSVTRTNCRWKLSIPANLSFCVL